MEELTLDEALYNNMLGWMHNKYSLNTIHQYANYMKKLFKKYGVLNRETVFKMSKSMKHQNQRAVLSAINEYCFERQIDFHIIVPKIKKREVRLPEILSPEEIKLMITAAPYPYNLAIRCIFNMGAGLRVSEIIKMRWQDIRWIDWLTNQENYGIAMIKAGKGSKDRPVNIPKNLMRDLYEFAKESGSVNEFKVPSQGQIFFFDKQKNLGNIYKPEIYSTNIERWKHEYVKHCYDWFRHNILKKCCEKAIGKKIKIHQLRHSKATYLYEVEKVPVEKIQVLLGHASLNTTMLYTKINPISVFELIKETKEI